ncbi:hypothetical protein DCC79_01585 [bacterium]|nr:MAG: hypothetical protein DCC79_01585 [bacterium]
MCRRRRASRAWRTAGLVAACGVAVAVSAPPASTPARAADGGLAWIATWQSDLEPEPGGVLDPVDLAVGADGSAWVVDAGLRRALRFDAGGTARLQVGRPGLDNGGLDHPFGIAVDEAGGRVFVADRRQGRLAVFDLAGDFVAHWNDYAKPEAIARDAAGRVFVFDRGASAIVGRKADGSRAVNIPVPFSPTDQATLPNGLAVAPDGRIWIATEAPVAGGPAILWVYGPDGEVIPPRTQIRGWNPRDIAIDPTGRVFMLDGTGGRLVTDFDRASGNHAAVGVGSDVRAIAAAAPDTLYLLDGPTGDREGGVTAVRYGGRTLTTLWTWRFPPIEPGWLSHPIRAAVGEDGGLYVVDEMERAQRFDARGRVTHGLRRLGMQLADATADGDWLIVRTRTASSIDDPRDPDVAPQGHRRIRIERYGRAGAAGEPARTWSFDWAEPIDGAERSQIIALGHDPARGAVYALDAARRRVLVLDLATGSRRAEWPLAEQGGGLALVDLDVLPDGSVAVLNAQSRRLLRLDAAGRVVGGVDVPAGAIRFAPLADGGFAVVLAARSLVRLTASGAVLGTAVLPAPARGAPEAPSDVAAAADGRVFVTDRGGQAVHVFGLAATAPRAVFLPVAVAGTAVGDQAVSRQDRPAAARDG